MKMCNNYVSYTLMLHVCAVCSTEQPLNVKQCTCDKISTRQTNIPGLVAAHLSYTQAASECLNKCLLVSGFEEVSKLWPPPSPDFTKLHSYPYGYAKANECDEVYYVSEAKNQNCLLTANPEFLLNKWKNLNKNGTQTERHVNLTVNFRTTQTHFHSLYFV
jgi:hypothetical protein